MRNEAFSRKDQKSIWQKLVGNVVAQIKKEIERVKEEMKSAEMHNQWDNILSGREVIREVLPPELPKKEMPYPTEQIKKTEQFVDDFTRKKIINMDEKKKADIISYDVNQLRKAVVWAEIIAPPLSLRD
ncbi:MAG: hypothetical protein HQK76_08490 [Desulfobacterales bacterium]|nr:hypothetical protein [Desulfobacterales bacterium]